jgi:hypothetical protein
MCSMFLYCCARSETLIHYLNLNLRARLLKARFLVARSLSEIVSASRRVLRDRFRPPSLTPGACEFMSRCFLFLFLSFMLIISDVTVITGVITSRDSESISVMTGAPEGGCLSISIPRSLTQSACLCPGCLRLLYAQSFVHSLKPCPICRNCLRSGVSVFPDGNTCRG